MRGKMTSKIREGMFEFLKEPRGPCKTASRAGRVNDDFCVLGVSGRY